MPIKSRNSFGIAYVRTGIPVLDRVVWGILDALDQLRIQPGPTASASTGPGGTVVTAAAPGPIVARSGGSGALTLTTTPPAGYDPGEDPPAGIPIWVTWGTVGGIIPPPETFTPPIGYVTSAGTRYVWAKVGISTTVSMLATSLAFVSSTSSTGFVTANFTAEGYPPEFMYIPLGRFSVTSSGASLVVTPTNAGSGSLVVAMHVRDVDLVSSPGASLNGTVLYSRQLSFWRTPNA